MLPQTVTLLIMVTLIELFLTTPSEMKLTVGLIVIAVVVFAVSSTELPDECFTTLVQGSNCEWYEKCLEKKFNCGARGYPLGYGKVYCGQFGNFNSFILVRDWVQKTTACLKQRLVPYLYDNVDMTCKKLKQTAFATHPKCYDEAGFCRLFKKLGVKDSVIFAKELLKTYKVKDFQSVGALKDVAALAKDCLREWI